MKKTICFVCVILTLCGCGNQKKAEDKRVPSSFMDLAAIKEIKDGWYMSLDIAVDKKDPTSFSYKDNADLNTINSIVVDVEDIKCREVDEEPTNVIVDGVSVVRKGRTMTSYIRTKKYATEMKNIEEFLSEKKFKTKITLEDLTGLETNAIDKKDLVELYNTAITRNKEYQSRYPMKGSNRAQKTFDNGDVLQVSYISEFIEIGACEIEYIYNNDTYLSDLVRDGKATKDQIALQKKFDLIEENIIKTQEIKSLVNVGVKEIDQEIQSLFDTCLNKGMIGYYG